MTSDEHSPPGPGPSRRSAIALTYEGVSAPKVSATGDGELAEAIIREAQAQGGVRYEGSGLSRGARSTSVR